MLRELVLAAATFLLAEASPAASPPEIKVIVHRDNPVASISRAELSAIFMKRSRRWRHGVEAVPVDHPAHTKIRESFSAQVHKTSVAFVIRYWHRLLFSGRDRPPHVARSDAEVIEIVGARPGAVGYVDARAELTEAVKVVVVTP